MCLACTNSLTLLFESHSTSGPFHTAPWWDVTIRDTRKNYFATRLAAPSRNAGAYYISACKTAMIIFLGIKTIILYLTWVGLWKWRWQKEKCDYFKKMNKPIVWSPGHGCSLFAALCFAMGLLGPFHMRKVPQLSLHSHNLSSQPLHAVPMVVLGQPTNERSKCFG